MEPIMSYLKKHKTYKHGSQGLFELKLWCGLVVVSCKDDVAVMHDKPDLKSMEMRIRDFLESRGIEIRFCEECGKPMTRGYTTDCGDWYCCEECFEDVMNYIYGKGNWRDTDKEGELGGFYQRLSDLGAEEWEDTGIFWTDWND